MAITSQDYEVIISIVDERVEKIKVTREDFNALKGVVEELAEAQKRTEEKVEKLAEVVKELALGLDATRKEVRRVALGLDATRREVGGLTHTIGYTLENQAIKVLPALLKKEKGIEITEGLKRTHIPNSEGVEEEINIYGKGRWNGKEIWIIGEAQSQLSIKHIQKFIRKVKRIDKVLPGEKYLICITHSAPSSVLSFAEKNNIKVYLSYEL